GGGGGGGGSEGVEGIASEELPVGTEVREDGEIVQPAVVVRLELAPLEVLHQPGPGGERLPSADRVHERTRLLGIGGGVPAADRDWDPLCPAGGGDLVGARRLVTHGGGPEQVRAVGGDPGRVRGEGGLLHLRGD